MNSERLIRAGGVLAAVGLAVLVFTHINSFGNVSVLGGILFCEVLIFCLWKYDQFFFPLLMVMFVWAGTAMPAQRVGTEGRWIVLAAGASVGLLMWMKRAEREFGAIHLLAAFCVAAAFVSASVSPFPQMASYKALSLLLLFLYCSSGARLAISGHPERFFRGLVLAVEWATGMTAVFYFVLGVRFWGNPNSLGAVTSILFFPILLWGWFTSAGSVRIRRTLVLLVCAFLVFYSGARAGMASILFVTLVFCLALQQYRVLAKVAWFILAMVAVTGVIAPATLERTAVDLKDEVLYKGHKEEGVFGSRRTPWENSVQAIKERPLFGTGYGTSPTGDEPGTQFGRFSSTAETAREHGSSYLTIVEWTGLLGALPFLLLLLLTLAHVWRAVDLMNRTRDPRHFVVPLAMVVLSGLVHAGFEDWLFAVGAYPSVFLWVCAFLLADLLPSTAAGSVPQAVSRRWPPAAGRMRAVAHSK